jgi:hypothetical protein
MGGATRHAVLHYAIATMGRQPGEDEIETDEDHDMIITSS